MSDTTPFIHNGVLFSGIRPIAPDAEPSGACVFASPVWYPKYQVVWWRLNWSDLCAVARTLPFYDHPTWYQVQRGARR